MPAVRPRGRTDRDVPKPRSDAYVGLLGISLLALTAAMLFAFLNWNAMSGSPKAVQAIPKGGTASPPPGGPVNPQPGGPLPPGQPGGPVPPGAQPGVPVPPPGQPAPPQKKQ